MYDEKYEHQTAATGHIKFVYPNVRNVIKCFYVYLYIRRHINMNIWVYYANLETCIPNCTYVHCTEKHDITL